MVFDNFIMSVSTMTVSHTVLLPKILRVAPIPPVPHAATTDLFTVFVGLLFPECRIVRITQTQPSQTGFFHLAKCIRFLHSIL